MSNSLILYVGKSEAGQALAAVAEQRNDYVYLPENLMQALGMYITYFPQIVILDMSVDYAAEVLEHLRSVDASPIVLLTEKYIRSTTIFTLAPDLSAEALMSALERLHQPQPKRVSNGVLHYASNIRTV